MNVDSTLPLAETVEPDALRSCLRAALAAKEAEDPAVADLVRRAVEMAERADDDKALGEALALSCIVQHGEGEAEAAITSGHRALELLEATGRPAELAELYAAMSLSYNEMGLHGQALDLAARALEDARSVADLGLVSMSLVNVGITHMFLDQRDDAVRFLTEAVEAARQGGDTHKQYRAVNSLAATYAWSAKRLLQQGGPDDAIRQEAQQAREHGLTALQLATVSKHLLNQCKAHANLGVAHACLGELDQALEHIEQTERLAVQGGFMGLKSFAIAERALVLSRRGDHAEAVRLLQEVLDDTDPHETALPQRLHTDLYRIYKRWGDMTKALHHLELALPFERRAMRQQADAGNRLLLNRLDTELARAEARRARLDAEVQRMRAQQLEGSMQKLQAEAHELGKRVMEDQLTGLANRRRVDQDLPRRLNRCRRGGTSLCLAAIDIDHFKAVNDNHGHGVGDDVLRTVASLLERNTRESDLVARIGGEEFLVVFGTDSPSAARDACERLREAVAAHDWTALVGSRVVTISVGLCDAAGASDMRGALERADGALYAAKHAGRNRVAVAASCAEATFCSTAPCASATSRSSTR